MTRPATERSGAGVLMRPGATIIIPTTCSALREAALHRAVLSVRNAAAEPVTILLVANGPAVCESLLAKLLTMPGVTGLRREEGSAPNAVAAGRAAVDTEFFGVLDDDDELVHGALGRRLAVLRERPDVDVIVSNGWREAGGILTPMNGSMSGIDSQPLRVLLERNYLASCAALYRSASVSTGFFQDPHGYGEWTWLGFRLCLAGMSFQSLSSRDYIVHDTPGSLSKSDLYLQSYVSLFDRMLAEDIPRWARSRILAKRAAAYHEMAARALVEGDRGRAARLHWLSLRQVAGLRYISFTRRLLSSLPRAAR